MKKLFTFLLLTIALQSFAQYTSTLPSGFTPFATQMYWKISGTDTLFLEGATGKGFHRFTPTQALKDSLFLKVDKVTGKSLLADTEITRLLGMATGATANRSDAATDALLADKVDKVAGKSLLSDTEITRLLSMATGATANSTDAQLRDRSTHTGTQAPGTIVQDASNRFVTDSEKAVWDAKQNALGYTPENVANKGVTYASLNEFGVIPNSQIPPLALVQTFVRGSEADMLLLSTAEQGDVCIRTDLSKTFILTDANYNMLSSWKELLSPVIPAETDPGVPAYAKSLSGFSVIQSSTDALYEPLFGKNTAFNKNFGTTAGTVAQGDDSRITNGQTAFGWGNHAGLYYTNGSTVVNSTQWAGNSYVAGLGTIGYLMSWDGTAGAWRVADVAGVQGWLSVNNGATLNNNISGNAASSDGVIFKDNRAVVDQPQDIPSQRASFNFKDMASVNNPPINAGNGYAYIGNYSGYVSGGVGGGGFNVQVSYGDGIAVRQAGSTTAWGPWRTLWHDGNFNPVNYLPKAGGTMSGNISSFVTGGTVLNIYDIDSRGTTLQSPGSGNGFVGKVGTTTNHDFQIITGNIARYTIDVSGNNTWSGSGTFGGDITIDNGKYLKAKRADGIALNVLGFDAGAGVLSMTASDAFVVKNTGAANLFHLDANTKTATLYGQLSVPDVIYAYKPASDVVLEGGAIYMPGGYTSLRTGTDQSFNIDNYNSNSRVNALKITQAGNFIFSGSGTFGSSLTATSALFSANVNIGNGLVDSRIISNVSTPYALSFSRSSGTYIHLGANLTGDLIVSDQVGNQVGSWSQTGSLTASNFSGSSSGTNTGDQTWSTLSGKPTFAAVATSGLYSDLSGRPTALSGFTNDLISAWALAPAKPSYSWTEITSKPTTLSAFTNDLGNYGGWITPSSAETLTNKGGNISMWTNDMGYITTASAPVQLADFFIDGANSGSSETAVYSYTLPANRLNAVGEKIIAEYYVKEAIATGVTLYNYIDFAGTRIFMNGIGSVGLRLRCLKVFIMRTGSSTAKASVVLTYNGGSPTTTHTDLSGLNFTTTNDLVLSVQGDTNSSEIIAKSGSIQWLPAAP